MVYYAATIGLAVLAVVVTKGSWQRLGRIHLSALPLLLVALAIQAVLEIVDFPKDRVGDVGLGILMLSYALILAFCLVNLGTKGIGIVTIGIALNALVIGLNQGMPTKPLPKEQHGHEVTAPIDRTVKHRPESDHDLLGFLGDKITPPGDANEAVSVGDLVVLLGVVDVCFEASRRPRARGARLAASPAGSA